MQEIAQYMADNSLCALGKTGANPVLSTLRYFRDEYEAHIKEHRCPASVCKKLINYYVIPEKCIGCTICARNCPADAIDGELKKVHHINIDKCVKCGICMSKCPKQAIYKK
jgi:NADP-reducing hydrogenase subunit HndC